MTISSFLVLLSLALSARSWPQHPFDPEDLGDSTTLPVIPYSLASGKSLSVVDEELLLKRNPEDDGEDKPFHILPFNGKRTILVEDDDVSNRLTLPVLQRRSVDKDRPFHILPFNGKRKILVEDDDVSSRMTLPVSQRARRSDDEDKPFHILPFDAKRGLPADDIPPGILTLPVIRAWRPTLVKRAVQVQVENRSDVSYYAQLNIGTPPQKVYAQIDTGSFELWVNPDCSQVRSADQNFCRAVGRYDPSSSSTSTITTTTNSLRYGIGLANVTYVRDSIALPGSTPMKQVQFGVASSSRDQFSGILGIGYGLGINTRYKNFIDELAAQGITKTKAFSLALGSKDEEEGVIIFGGVDTAKFQGKLAQLPIVPAQDAPDGVARYWVNLNSISLSPPTGTSTTFTNSKMTVFLDSGATLTLLPPNIVKSIAQALGSKQLNSNGFYTVDCGMADQKGTIDFSFNGITIQAPYNEMIRQVNTLPPNCYLGMMPSNDFALLGDTFLRSAYAVFDLSANMAYLAQYANCGTKLQTINSSSDLQDLSGTCNAAQQGSGPSSIGASTKTMPAASLLPSITTLQIATGSPTLTTSISPSTATGVAGAVDSSNTSMAMNIGLDMRRLWVVVAAMVVLV